jgi:RHS repeat-associated protein
MTRQPTTETFNDDAGNPDFGHRGNRLTQDITYFDQSRSTTGAYNAANELTGLEISSPSTSPTNVTFEHNKRGGRTKMTTNAGGSDSVVVNYGYNEDNSMTQYGVVAPGRQLNVAFAYSGGLRVEKQVTGFITTGGQQQVYNAHKKYLLDGVDVLLELQVIGSNTVVTALHIPGVLSATLIEGGASVVRYQLHDAQGNVIALVDADQEVPTVYLQDSWGIPLVDTDCQTVNLASSPIQVESVPNPYRWGGAHGYYADEDVGMYLMGYRWYDSFTGRFISRDPIGFAAGDMNQYRPMGNNPVNAVDPWGLQHQQVTITNAGAEITPHVVEPKVKFSVLVPAAVPTTPTQQRPPTQEDLDERTRALRVVGGGLLIAAGFILIAKGIVTAPTGVGIGIIYLGVISLFTGTATLAEAASGKRVPFSEGVGSGLGESIGGSGSWQHETGKVLDKIPEFVGPKVSSKALERIEKAQEFLDKLEKATEPKEGDK